MSALHSTLSPLRAWRCRTLTDVLSLLCQPHEWILRAWSRPLPANTVILVSVIAPANTSILVTTLSNSLATVQLPFQVCLFNGSAAAAQSVSDCLLMFEQSMRESQLQVRSHLVLSWLGNSTSWLLALNTKVNLPSTAPVTLVALLQQAPFIFVMDPNTLFYVQQSAELSSMYDGAIVVQCTQGRIRRQLMFNKHAAIYNDTLNNVPSASLPWPPSSVIPPNTFVPTCQSHAR